MLNKKQVIIHLIEFFFVGLVLGVTEDIIAIHLATGTEVTLETFKVALLVAFPFAVVSELIIDVKFFRQALKNALHRLGKK